MRFLFYTAPIFIFLFCNVACLEAADSGSTEPAKTNTHSSEEIKFPADWRNFKMPSRAEMAKYMSAEEIQVTQDDGTEAPFRNRYWDNKEPGIYVDIVSGEPLFVSSTKYKSGTGWPSFYQPIDPKHVKLQTDYKLGYPRTEVRSKIANSHLGHVFDDGPKPTGKRYCMNSAAMRFIPKSKLQQLGYGDYLKLFEKAKAESTD